MTTQTIITIGYYHFHLPVGDATKVLELLAKSRIVNDAYDHDAKRRGAGVKSSYWHVKTDETVPIRVDVIHDVIEDARRPDLPEEETPSEN
jgi:hypothetical protein